MRDPEKRVGPYAYWRNQLVSFDDIDQIAEKTRYIKDMGLGGGMLWALDLDDFRNRCGCEAHPLLKTMNRGLGRMSTPPPANCNLLYTNSTRQAPDNQLGVSTPKTPLPSLPKPNIIGLSDL